MATQTEQGNQGFLHSAGGQTVLLLAVIVVVCVLAWAYVW